MVAKTKFKGALFSLFLILPFSTIQSGSTFVSGDIVLKSDPLITDRTRRVLLDAYESLEDFTLGIASFFPKISEIKRRIFTMKKIYLQAKTDYDSSYMSEFLLYLFGFKWLWGIFTLYRSSYIVPSREFLERSSRNLFQEEKKLQDVRIGLKDMVSLLARNLANLSSFSPIKDSSSLRRVKAKLQRISSQLDQLLTAIDASLEFEDRFDIEVFQGRNRYSYKNGGSTSSFGGGISATSTYSNESDLTSRQIWEKTQKQRYQEESERLKQEILSSKAIFEDLSSVVSLKREIDSFLSRIKGADDYTIITSNES